MTAKEKELLVTEMKELEALMTVASKIEVFLFSASFHTGEKYQCLPADRDNAFCKWYCGHELDAFKKTPREACLYFAKNLKEFVRLDQTTRNSFRY